MSAQLDLIRHSDAGLALAYRQAAEAARRNPFETPDQAEKRARHYDEQAQRYEGRR
jgi:hypothetical protein